MIPAGPLFPMDPAGPGRPSSPGAPWTKENHTLNELFHIYMTLKITLMSDATFTLKEKVTQIRFSFTQQPLLYHFQITYRSDPDQNSWSFSLSMLTSLLHHYWSLFSLAVLNKSKSDGWSDEQTGDCSFNKVYNRSIYIYMRDRERQEKNVQWTKTTIKP